MKLFYRYLATLLLTIYSFSSYAEGGTALSKVKLETTLGDIVIELNAEKAPDTVTNFLSYVSSPPYYLNGVHKAAIFFI